MIKLSVLMPVYNGQSFLRESIESVLRQTYTDFEFIIVDDGSTDHSAEIIVSYADPRIRLIRQDTNQGLIRTLNSGISEARGAYIARMDSDDVCLPQRLERQLAFMDARPEVGVCGTWFRTINATRERNVRPPCDSAEIKSHLLFECPLAHPSVMFRREVIEKLDEWYRLEYKHAEDYDLWARLSNITELANLPEVLLHYREHSSQVSSSHANGQQASANAVRTDQLRAFMPRASEKEVQLHLAAACNMIEQSPAAFSRIEDWLTRLVEFNAQTKRIPNGAFTRVAAERWASICCSNASAGWWTLCAMKRSPLIASSRLSRADRIRQFLKWLYLRLSSRKADQ